jgi:integrase
MGYLLSPGYLEFVQFDTAALLSGCYLQGGPMRKTLTDKGVAALKSRDDMYRFADPEMRSHYVKIEPSGVKTFWVQARNPAGNQKWSKVGDADVISIVESRKRGRKLIERIQAGLPAEEQAAETFAEVVLGKPDEKKPGERKGGWLKRYVDKKALRTAPEIKRLLNKFILPAWGDRAFTSIRRSDVNTLLDHVEDNNGARQADTVLEVVRSCMNWYATRHDDYVPPIVRGMNRAASTKERERKRILSDDEIRKVWKLTERSGTFGAIIQIALLTAQRRDKIVTMKWDDIKNGIWTIPTDPREKGNAGALALPKAALDVINKQPKMVSNPHVFSGRNSGYYNNLSRPKRNLDAQLKIPAWTIHDVRRSSRSLLSRTGTPSEISEKIMGHVTPGVEGTYDRFTYDAEKKLALEKLASLIDGIIHQRENVVPMAKRKKS